MSVSLRLASLTRQMGRVSMSTSLLQPASSSLLLPCSSPASSLRAFSDDYKSAQHDEWVKFQKTVSVEGFETGHTMDLLKKKRGGKARRKQAQAALADQEAGMDSGLAELGGGEYPPLRYSDEETERLLAEAYAAIPERAGKRGTRNKKRQEKRWHLVRQVREKYKHHLAQHQERKMQKRSQKIQSVKAVLDEAPDIRERDREYQAQVLQRWAATMVQGQGEM